MKKALLGLAILVLAANPLFGVGESNENATATTSTTNSVSGSPPVVTTTTANPTAVPSAPGPSVNPMPQLQAAREAALKANPDLAAEEKELKSELHDQEDKFNAAMVKADPTVAPIVAKLAAIQQRAEAAALSTSSTGTPPSGAAQVTITPDEWQQLRAARVAVLQNNPELTAGNAQLMERMRAHQAKLQAAMIKADPTLAPLLAPLPARFLPGNAHPMTPTAAAAPVHDLIDVDAMAARMKTHQDLYQKIRDESLAVYAKSQPRTPMDDEMKTLIRLMAYLWVWGDFYGEGLWRQGDQYARNAWLHNVQDPLLETFLEEKKLGDSHTLSEDEARATDATFERLLASEYPVEFKLQACAVAIGNLVNHRTYENPGPDADSLKQIPVFFDQWVQNYRQMIKDKMTHDMLYGAANNLLCVGQNDQGTLDLAIAEIDRDFNEIDPDNPVKIALDGQYYVDAAWCARGSGWANSVTDQGWQLFSQRLAKADEILETGYSKYPDEGEMARTMLNVELGQGQGRDRMETWFQRAIKADPDDYDAYKAKEWYLQPRWYGSVDDILSFGQECVKTGNWSAKLPMILTTGIAEAADQDPTLYSRPDVWALVEKTYRDYLDQYPKSTFYRTAFAKHAFDSGRLDIAREQFKILGDDWDRSTITEQQYTTIVGQLGL